MSLMSCLNQEACLGVLAKSTCSTLLARLNYMSLIHLIDLNNDTVFLDWKD